MIAVAWRNLLHDKTKGALSVLGVAMSAFLIFTVYGVYTGIDEIMEETVTGAGADIWVTQEGTSGSLHSPSILPRSASARLSDIPGVADWRPLIRTAVSYEQADGNSTLLFLNGFQPESRLGGPWRLAEGSATLQEGEIILDRVFARANGLSIGDLVEIRGIPFTVSALSDRTNIMVGFFAFIRFEDAVQFLGPGLVNSLLVRVSAGESVNEVARAIEDGLDGVSVRTNESMVVAYKDEVIGSFVPILLVLSAISIVVGVLSVGLLIYMLTLERSREYGIIKAIGGSNGYLYRIVLLQSVLISVVGFALGVGISFPLVSLIQNNVPEFVVSISSRAVLWGIPAFIGAGVLSSLIPIRKLVTIDPAIAFEK